MKNKSSLIPKPQLSQKIQLQYLVAGVAVLAMVVASLFTFLNFGNSEKIRAATMAGETGITTYQLTAGSNGSLTNMDNGTTQIIGPNQSNVSSPIQSLGFNFVFMGKVYNSFSVNANGVLRFGNDPIVPGANTFGIPGNDRIAAFAISGAIEYTRRRGWRATEPDLRTHNGNNNSGKVHFKVYGNAPNRIIVIEWKNMQIPAGSGSNDGTFQLRLYESDAGSGALSGAIEMVYGNMKVGNERLVNYRVGFGVGPEVGNFYSVRTSDGTLSDTDTYENANNSVGNLNSNNNNNRKYFRFVSSRRPTGSFNDFSLTCPSPNSVSLKFNENCDDEAGLVVYRKKLGEGDNKFSMVKSLISDARVLTDGGITIGEQYVYRFYFLGEGLLSTDFTEYTTEPIPSSSAYQTVASGDWTNPDTWGGTIPAVFEDVIIGCSGTVFISANSHVKVKNLTIESGSFFTIPDGQIVEVSGNFVNNGVFNPVGSGKVIFSGGSEQLIVNNGLGKTDDTRFTSTDPNQNWDDNDVGTVATKSINVTENDFLAIKEVLVNIEHDYLRDVTIYLVTPNGTRYKMAENRGQRGKNYTDVVFSPLGQPLPPSIQNVNLTGTYRPEESFSAYSGPLNGTWTLRVDDHMPGEGGTLRKFELVLTKGGSNELMVRNLDVNKSNGSLHLNSGLLIEGALNLQNGIVYTDSTHYITFENGATSNAGSVSSFIEGPVVKKGNQTFVFPVGRGGKWAPIGISNVRNANAGTTFSAEYLTGAKAGDNTLGDSDLQFFSNKEYWQLTPVIGSPLVDITLHWKDNPGDFINESSVDELVIAHYTSGAWINETSTLNPGSHSEVGGNGSITASDIDSFSPFTFGSTGINNPLPVELVSFKGEGRERENVLTWITASEKDNSHFEVEKSTDGQSFEKIGEVKGDGNSYKTISYTFSDYQLQTAASYYRLKQVDFDGKFEYSNIIMINNTFLKSEIQLYPNPAERSTQYVTLDLSSSKTKQAEIVIRNINGQIMNTIRISDPFELGKEELKIEGMATGIYLVEISMGKEKIIKRLIIR